jgi:hypothetical protein
MGLFRFLRYENSLTGGNAPERVKNFIGTQKPSREGGKPQSSAKQTKELFLASLCALASSPEAVFHSEAGRRDENEALHVLSRNFT